MKSYTMSRKNKKKKRAHATCLIAGRSLGTLVNSKEILLDLPLHLSCDMSLPAMWCSLPD